MPVIGIGKFLSLKLRLGTKALICAVVLIAVNTALVVGAGYWSLTNEFGGRAFRDIEVNLRTLALAFGETFKDARRPEPPLPPLRTLAAWYEGARNGSLPYNRTKIQSILASPPGPDRSSHAVYAIWPDWNRPLNRAMLLEHAQQIKALSEKLESQGVRVFFFEMPYPSRLRDSLFAKTMHEVFAQVIGPDDNRRLDLQYAVDEMRSVDGSHLDERSAVVFAAALDAAIREKFGYSE